MFSVGGREFSAVTGPVNQRAVEGGGFNSDYEEGVSDQTRFFGIMPPNPGFVYENSETTEVLIGFGREWRTSLRSAVALRDILEDLAGAAANRANAPIVFLQTPVASPPVAPRRDGSHEALRGSVSNTVRMSIAVSSGDDDARIGFLATVHEICKARGLSLHVADLRSGRMRGEWYFVQEFSSEVFNSYMERRYKVVPEQAVQKAVMLTVVGPARRGSTYAILGLLRSIGAGVAGGAISSLSECAVINLFVPLGSSYGPTPFDPAVQEPSECVRGLEDVCSLGPIVGRSPITASEVLRGYSALPSLAARFSCETEGDGESSPHPLWAAWDLPEAWGGELGIVEMLRRSVPPKKGKCRVSYARSKVNELGRVRGRAKLSVQLSPDASCGDVSGSLREIAEEAEQFLVAHILSQAGDSARPSEAAWRLGSLGSVRVTSRERWIGRVRFPL